MMEPPPRPDPPSPSGPAQPDPPPPPADAVITAMVQAIVAEADPEQVILFGSRGRGDHHERSDVDLIVVESEPFRGRSRHQEIMRLMSAVRPFGVATDVLVYSADEVDYWRDSINHVLARALREGQVLYERP